MDDKLKSYRNSLYFILFFNALTLLLQLLVRIKPGFSEWYAITIYPSLVSTISRISSIFRFSLVELLLFLLFLYCIAFILKRNSSFKKITIHIGIFITVILFIFNLTCGMNYQRNSFASFAGLLVEESSTKELESLSKDLIDTANDLSSKITVDKYGSMTFKTDPRVSAVLAMKKLGKTYPVLSGYYPQPKPVFTSILMSYQQITGIYSPFTMEANYNKDIPTYDLLEVMCHELAHLKGFMREDEAEFIAILASRNSDDLSFQYSGNLIALNYCLNAIYSTGNKTLYASLYNSLTDQIKNEFIASNNYWNKYDGIVSEISEKTNDAYLKINDQSEGVKSYGKVLDLLLAEHRKYK